MSELGLFAVLVVALAIGWWMGRRRGARPPSPITTSNDIPKDYFRGLNHLLKGQQSEAIDAFIESLDVSSETFDIHLTLGTLFRKKGDIQKAISIHQNLLARPDLPETDTRLVQLELAQDFMSAGLLDRAERLLLAIAVRKSVYHKEILSLLIDLYEFEQSWDKAIKIAEQLSREHPSAKLARRLAHFYCELADSSVAEERWVEAFQYFRNAVEHDEHCVRGSIGMADVYSQQKRHRDAIKVLKNVAEQDPEFVPVVIPAIERAYQQVWSSSGYVKFLQEQNQRHPSATTIGALAAIYAKTDKAKAEQFVIEQLKTHPTIKGFQELIKMQIEEARGAQQQLNVLYNLIQQLTESKHRYRCKQCGFAGHQLHWQCPSCKSWGSVKPIHGLEGE
ncbi:lipopolysaccharide assembly protein LapB [Maribrevibacterium harenarium]|uniref:Lipopolysaccharide assembly protein B n=1 Tax=Maribrevibacterium harenarium TaxID=2589817 RepID=A0A501WF21_9GAMM|nr:lipopolysaccharide assembly protein LapB [Maribrevibacterium harenarium]TPE48018.1 lipopolysaccharide assembly protein LapB [Maribrevibacterium harenarium]